MSQLNIEGTIRLVDKFSAVAERVSRSAERMKKGISLAMAGVKASAVAASAAFVSSIHFIKNAAGEEIERFVFSQNFNKMKDRIGWNFDQLKKLVEEKAKQFRLDDSSVGKSIMTPLMSLETLKGRNLGRAFQAVFDIGRAKGKTTVEGFAEIMSQLKGALQMPEKAVRMVKAFDLEPFTEKEKKKLKALQASKNYAAAQDMILSKIEKKYKGFSQSTEGMLFLIVNSFTLGLEMISKGIGNIIGQGFGQYLLYIMDTINEVGVKMYDFGDKIKEIGIVETIKNTSMQLNLLIAGILAFTATAIVSLVALAFRFLGLNVLLKISIFLVKALGKAMKAAFLFMRAHPLMLIISALMLIVTHWDDIKAAVGKVWDFIKSIDWGRIGTIIKDSFFSAIDFIYSKFKSFFSDIAEMAANIGSSIASMFGFGNDVAAMTEKAAAAAGGRAVKLEGADNLKSPLSERLASLDLKPGQGSVKVGGDININIKDPGKNVAGVSVENRSDPGLNLGTSGVGKSFKSIAGIRN